MTARAPALLATLLALAAPGVLAQKATGAYEGTATITFTEVSGKNKETYAATVKLRVPMESTSTGGSRAEADPGAPPMVAKVTAIETEQEATAKGLDGKFMRVTCKLAAPVDIPMMAQGSIDLDHRKKEYAMYIALISMKDAAVNCVNSQSGPYKGKKGVGLSLGTYLPHLGVPTAQPYSDPARLVGKATLKDPQGVTIVQEWDLKLVK